MPSYMYSKGKLFIRKMDQNWLQNVISTLKQHDTDDFKHNEVVHMLVPLFNFGRKEPNWGV